MNKLAVKTISFFTILLVCHILMYFPISHYLRKPYFFDNLIKLDALLENKTDIIYFNDSVNRSFDDLEKDRRTLSDMVKDDVASYTAEGIEFSGYNMVLYLEFVKYILKQKHHPRVIILPLNMRSFSVEWHLGPTVQWKDEIEALKSKFYYLFYCCLVLRLLPRLAHSGKY